MRLESVIFTIQDTLLKPDGSGEVREELDAVLSILKFAGVYMYGTADLSVREASDFLKQSGLDKFLKGVLTPEATRLPADSGKIFERAMVRLHSSKIHTMVFSGHLHAIEEANKAGFRTVAVKGFADEDEWQKMKETATESIESFRDLIESE